MVTLSNPTLSIERTTTTSEDGAFSFPLLPPAAGYSLVIHKDGFHEEKEDKLTVRVTETTVTNGKLALGSVNQEVLVTGSAQQLNTTDATLGEVVGTRVITSLHCPPEMFLISRLPTRAFMRIWTRRRPQLLRVEMQFMLQDNGLRTMTIV